MSSGDQVLEKGLYYHKQIMVSKKKRPPPGLDPIDASKKVKSETAGTSSVESTKSVSKASGAVPKKTVLPKDIDIKMDDDDDELVAHHNNAGIDDIPDWPEADLMELMKRMENNIPPKDSLRYDSRAEKLNWEEISFGSYSPAQCKEMWSKIQKRLRRFRLLKELLEDGKSWVSKPWTNFYRSERQNRHPDLPRRPLSTYMLFYLDKKDKVAKENPGLEMTNVSKYIAEMYKKLPAKRKQKYIDMAAAQRKEYEEKIEVFYNDHPELIPKAVQLKDAKSHANSLESGPRKPQTPFKLFCNDKLEQHKNDPNFDRNAIIENCKEQWRDMSDKKKIIWINWALEEEAKYQEELKSYMADNPDFVPTTVKTVLTKDEKSLKERIAGKPEKPPNSGYSLFSRLMLVSPDMKKVPPKERMAQVSRLWKCLAEDQKKKYQEQVVHMLDQYKLEYATYLESLPEEKRKEELLNNAPKRKPPVAKAVTVPPPQPKKEAPKQKKAVKPAAEGSTLFKGEPEPPPLNPYQLFLKTFMTDATHILPENRVKEAPRYWQMLPASDKEKQSKKLNEIKQKYIKDYEKFLKSLSQEELKEYSMQKAKMKQMEEIQSSEDSDSDDEEEEEEENGSKNSDAENTEKESESGENSSSECDSDSDDSSDSDSDAEKGKKNSDTSSSSSSDSDSD